MQNGITPEMVRQTIHQIVNQYGPDFVYQKKGESGGSCLYVHDGQPDCLVGKVLHALGVPLSVMQEREGSSATNVAGSAFGLNYEDPHYFVVRALDSAQRQQDSGETWGEALAAFNTEYDAALAVA